MQLKRRCICCVLAMLFAFIMGGVYAGTSEISVGRYTFIENKPLPSQLDLLSQVKTVQFSKAVVNLGDGIQSWLRSSGYRLVSHQVLEDNIFQLLNLPLPEVDRRLGPLSLGLGLETLVGKPFYLLIDPVHRSVSFHLKEKFQFFNPQKKHKPTEPHHDINKKSNKH